MASDLGFAFYIADNLKCIGVFVVADANLVADCNIAAENVCVCPCTLCRTRIGRNDNEIFINNAEVPLLFEAGMEKQFDEIITVTAPLETILQRLQQGRGLSPQQARARMAAQMSQEEKSRRSTLTIVNDGDIPAMQDQIQQWIKEKQDGTESERRIPQ